MDNNIAAGGLLLGALLSGTVFAPTTAAAGKEPVWPEQARTSPRHSTEYSLYLASIAAAERALRLDETHEARRWLAMAPEKYRNWCDNHVVVACL